MASSAGQQVSQPLPLTGQNIPMSHPPLPPPPSQRPTGPVLSAQAGTPSAIASHQVIHGSDIAGRHDPSQMQYSAGSHPPPRVGQVPPMGPPPMNQPGMPPHNLPPVNPGPQTAMSLGFAPPESHAPHYASQGGPPPMHAAPSEMSGSGQFSAQPLPPHSQMNAAGGMPGYNYTSQPRIMQPPSQPAGAPMSQPQPRKLDPDQMPSPVS